MLSITRFAVEGLAAGCVTDKSHPNFSFALESDGKNITLASATLQVGDWKTQSVAQTIQYAGPVLQPFTAYHAVLEATASNGDTARAELDFETGRMDDAPWQGQWISDPAYHFTEKKVSPLPMVFRKAFRSGKPVAKARLYVTAMGIYELELNGQKVGSQWFAPGFTSYKTNLQYQTYDVTRQLSEYNTLVATVAGGWAVGSFVFTRVNRVTADRQALLAELRITYTDGSEEVIGTDSSWQVTEDGSVRMADWYDGETYDATVDMDRAGWHASAPESLRVSPAISAEIGAPVKIQKVIKPISCTQKGSELIYDFGQNFAGVVQFTVKGRAGQIITIRHAEILNPDGSLNTVFLRSAKATLTYTCREGVQTWHPRFTYMGFRYISVTGVDQADLTVEALALWSDVRQIGSFECSDKMLNQLQSNIQWGARSNFMDIPTDCPQRDERMGWTGDIAVFAPTACFNFDMGRFLKKWLRDVKNEQLKTGGIPNTVPVQGYGFPATMPEMAIAWWGDACVLVPWAMYQATGDEEVLRSMYPTMKKYVGACKFWAGLFSTGKRKYIWAMPGPFSFGDWVAPDVPQMSQWQGRNKWTGTASLCNTSGILAKIARILGSEVDAETYQALSDATADAYCSLLTDGNGKLLEEFQTAYVLPLYLKMFPENVRAKAVENLVRLVEKSNYCIGTGFPGTPYILFALADNGRPDVAYRMLMNTKCPSWLYEVRVGATTIWERWDGLDENGTCPIGDDGTDQMISYNHYASGAVGAFLYRRIAGLDALEPGYKRFAVKPVIGGGLTSAKAQVETPYGLAGSSWKIENGILTVTVTVPVGTSCEVTLPGGTAETFGSGVYTVSEKYQ